MTAAPFNRRRRFGLGSHGVVPPDRRTASFGAVAPENTVHRPGRWLAAGVIPGAFARCPRWPETERETKVKFDQFLPNADTDGVLSFQEKGWLEYPRSSAQAFMASTLHVSAEGILQTDSISLRRHAPYPRTGRACAASFVRAYPSAGIAVRSVQARLR